jgi:putative hemolysin
MTKNISKVFFELKIGRFFIKTATTEDELSQAFALRHQVFKVEGCGYTEVLGFDSDKFDSFADHLLIIDDKSKKVIATARLISSDYTTQFYSEQEFQIAELLKQEGIKVEIGRVCVNQDYRKGITILILWRAIAEYMITVKARFLFGCASVMTEDPHLTSLLYRYLSAQKKINSKYNVSPTEKYNFSVANELIQLNQDVHLSNSETETAVQMLPSLCRSYFDMGCFAAGKPAYDKEFKCVDFFTYLDLNELNPIVAKKMFGDRLK